jgi:hypothetical protein
LYSFSLLLLSLGFFFSIFFLLSFFVSLVESRSMIWCPAGGEDDRDPEGYARGENNAGISQKKRSFFGGTVRKKTSQMWLNFRSFSLVLTD